MLITFAKCHFLHLNAGQKRKVINIISRVINIDFALQNHRNRLHLYVSLSLLCIIDRFSVRQCKKKTYILTLSNFINIKMLITRPFPGHLTRRSGPVEKMLITPVLMLITFEKMLITLDIYAPIQQKHQSYQHSEMRQC